MNSEGDIGVPRPRGFRPTTPLGHRLVRHIVGFGVGVGVGLAPYLGLLEVPLFRSLLTLIPESVRDTVLPLSAALMGTLAVVVQWYGGERLTRKGLRKMFARTLLTVALTFVLLTVIHTLVVVSVPIENGRTLSFVVGFSRPVKRPCPAEISDAECLQLVTFDPAEIASFWGDRQVRAARLSLIFSYLLFTSSFGSLVGLVVLREGVQGQHQQAS